VDAGAKRAIGFWGRYSKSNFGERQTHRLPAGCDAVPPVADCRDDDVVHLDDEEFLLTLAGLAMVMSHP